MEQLRITRTETGVKFYERMERVEHVKSKEDYKPNSKFRNECEKNIGLHHKQISLA